jgi:hypothetical protein
MPNQLMPIDEAALRVIEELVKKGCDRARLDMLLRILGEARARSGMMALCGYADGRALKKSIKLLREAADCIRRWKASFAGHEMLEQASADAEMRIFSETPAPEFLELVAIAMKVTYYGLASQRDFLPRLARAWLTNYVYACTKKWHDAEVADLVAAAAGSEVTYTDQKQWRQDNHALLQSERARFKWAIPPILRQER